MRTLDRQTETAAALHDAVGTGDPGFDGLAAVRAEAGRLLVVARDAIRRARSVNSIDFLRHSRQEGGE